MTYVKLNWENLPSENTPISAERLSHMETQYDEAMQEVDQKLPISRGTLPTGTNLNLLRLETDAGSWHITSSNTYLNGPTTPAEAVILTVEVGNTQNAAKQTWTEGGSRSASMYYRKLVTPTGDGGNPLWTPWEKVNNSSSLPEPMQLSGLAQRDGWLGLYDPSNLSSVVFNSDGTVSQILDSLGNLPPLVSTVGNPVTLVKNAFGFGHAISGPMYVTFTAPILQPGSVLVLARDNGKAGPSRNILGGGSASTRWQMRLGSDGKAWTGVGGTLRTGNADGYESGDHVWEAFYDAHQSTLSIDGRLAHRGLPGASTAGMSSMYAGCLFVSGGTVTNQWGGLWGAIAIRTGSNDTHRAEINRMRNKMMMQAGVTPARPWLWPETRALSLDSFGRERVVVGDPDQILSGSVASITKVLNAIVAREFLNTAAKLDAEVTVLPEDEFLTGNAPQLVAGDIASYRVLLQSMLIPSNNVAPRTIARTLGESLPGDGTGQEKYVALMNQRLKDWDFTWAWCSSNPGGGLRASMRQLAQLLLKAMEDPVLADMLSTARTDVTISGPNARTVEIVNSWVTRQTYGEMREWVASKDGTGTTDAGTVFLWDHPDGTQHVSVVQSSALGAPGRRVEFVNTHIVEADKNGGFFNPTTPAASFVGSGSPVVSPPVGW